MMEDAEAAELPAISAAWNAVYDVGLGAGPLAFAVVAAHTSTPGALALLALALCGGLLPAATRRRAFPEVTAPGGLHPQETALTGGREVSGRVAA